MGVGPGLGPPEPVPPVPGVDSLGQLERAVRSVAVRLGRVAAQLGKELGLALASCLGSGPLG
jgi:hypothetical protein